MRAFEFITENIELRHEPTSTGGVQVYAYVDDKEAGWVRFTKLKTGQVKAAMVHVPERLRRQGIGSAMYKYARHELGLDIVPSDSQTQDGKAFWNKIHEAFDNPYAFNWSRGDHGDYDVFVKLPDGSPLSIAFNHEDEDTWHVAFDRGHSQEITGEGDAQRIFATVLHSIKQFIGKQHPDRLYFSASKEVEPGQNSESRANLYSRMVKRYASAWGYDSVVDDFGRDNVTYILNKKQPVTEEEFNGIDIDMDIEGDEIMVTAMGNGRELGHVLFVDEGEYLMPQDLEVDERFQGQGIAAAMYDYVKSKGYKIRRSGQQTDAGAGFWGKHRPEQNVWENESSTPTMGINVRSDGNIDYAGLIIDGKKKYESRQTDSLRPYVGKTVAIVRTGKGPAVAIGQVTVGEPIVVDAEKFDKMRKLHLVPQGSKFDIGIDATKYLYPMINPIRWDNEKLVKQKGIVARKID